MAVTGQGMTRTCMYPSHMVKIPPELARRRIVSVGRQTNEIAFEEVLSEVDVSVIAVDLIHLNGVVDFALGSRKRSGRDVKSEELVVDSIDNFIDQRRQDRLAGVDEVTIDFGVEVEE